MSYPKELIPAILPENYNDLRGHIEALEGSVSLVQIDICDGKFVPSIKVTPLSNCVYPGIFVGSIFIG